MIVALLIIAAGLPLGSWTAGAALFDIAFEFVDERNLAPSIMKTEGGAGNNFVTMLKQGVLLQVYTSDTLSCTSTQTIDSDLGADFDLRHVGGDVFIAAYQDLSEQSVKFIKSTTAGATWTSPVTIDDAGDDGDAVSITSYSNSGWIIAYEGGVAQSIVAHSSNAGSTWTTLSVGATINSDNDGERSIAAKNSTHWLFVADSAGTTAFHTENAGVSWAGVSVSTNTGGPVYVTYSGEGEKYYATFGGTPRFGFTTDNGASWESSAVAGLSNAHQNKIHVNPSDPGHVVMAKLGDATANGADGALVKIIQSDDSGLTFAETDGVFECVSTPSCSTPEEASIGASDGGSLMVTMGDSNAETAIRSFAVASLVPGVEASASLVTTGNIVGFDVDRSGQNMIIRLAATTGSTIQSYAAQGLTLRASTANGCQSDHRVAAFETGVAYVECESAIENRWLHVRDVALAPYAYPTSLLESGVCDYCEPNIILSGGDGGGAELLGGEDDNTPSGEKLRQATFFVPVRRAVDGADAFFSDYAWTSWAFAQEATTGAERVGEMYWTHLKDRPDAKREDSMIFGTTTPNDICAAVGPNTNAGIRDSYIFAVGSGAATKGYRVIHEEQLSSPATPQRVLDGSITDPYTGGTANNDAIGVACENTSGEAWLATVQITTGTVAAFDYLEGTPKFSPFPTVTSPQTMGISISEDQQGFAQAADSPYIAVMDGTDAEIYNRTGALKCTIPGRADGDFKGVHIDALGQNLWIARGDAGAETGWVDRYDVQGGGCTTTAPITFGGTVDTPDAVADPGEGLAGVGAAVAAFFGLGDNSEAGLAILGILLMLAAALLGFIFTGGFRKMSEGEPIGKGPPAAGGIFAVVMFFVNGVVGLFNMAIIVGVVVLVVIAFLFTRRGD